MGTDAVQEVPALQPHGGSEWGDPGGLLRLIGGAVKDAKENLTWATVARYGAILTAAWQLFSYLDGMEKRLTVQITAVREEGIERRMEMRELQRRVDAIERYMEGKFR